MLGGVANITNGANLLHVAVSLLMNRITFLTNPSSIEDKVGSWEGPIFCNAPYLSLWRDRQKNPITVLFSRVSIGAGSINYRSVKCLNGPQILGK